MQFSESWLRTFADPSLSSAELAHLLTMSGLEVEEARPVAPPFTGIVVAQVLEVARHPNADRLSVCQVDAGTGSVLNIVCGAPNVRPGIKVPCALIGAQLPPADGAGAPFEIKPVKMRGVDSHGMLCSARELKLSDEHEGLMILPDDAPVGQDLRVVLDLDDQLLTLKLTPNRADCLSVFGVAREVAALTGAALRVPEFVPFASNSDERLPVRIDAPDLCGRFAGRVIRGLNARATTPEWMKQRLARSGQRSISALVDISNYVMLEFGRPTHVFDLEKIQGGLEVRWARRGESLKLLNGSAVELDEQIGVIADAAGRVESLAGIMGGEASAVSLETTDIYLEAAFWWPQAIQGRTRRFNFSTDAAHRFERGVDYASIPEHIEHITRLILDICGVPGKTVVGPVDDQIANLPQRQSVRMRTARAHKVIGVPVPATRIAEIFKRLDFHCALADDGFVVTPPSWRFDIEIEEDLIEEVARCFGYDHIPAKLPSAPHAMHAQPETLRSAHALRERMVATDYQEVLNFSFVEEQWESDFSGNAEPIRLLNPIASQLAVMRSTLIGSLLGNLRYNLNRQTERVRVFEIGRIFRRDATVADGPRDVAGTAQPLMLGALAYGTALDEQWGSPARRADFFDIKADLESLCAPLAPRLVKAEHPALHPGRSARIELAGQAVGWIGELHPRWVRKYELPDAPVLFEIAAAALQVVPLPVYREVPRFPAVTRDLALVFDQAVEAQAVLDAITAACTVPEGATQAPGAGFAPVREVSLFDEYRGKGLKDNEKSLAFRFRLQDTHQTLSDEMIERTLAHVTEQLQVKLGGRLR